MPAVPLADVTLQQKDMLLALELGRRLGSPVPLAAAANEMMNACRGLGLDHRDSPRTTSIAVWEARPSARQRAVRRSASS